MLALILRQSRQIQDVHGTSNSQAGFISVFVNPSGTKENCNSKIDVPKGLLFPFWLGLKRNNFTGYWMHKFHFCSVEIKAVGFLAVKPVAFDWTT